MIDVAFRGRLGAFYLDVAFTAPERGVTAIFGPSGCGKTSVLRCMAGLQRVQSGHCVVGPDTWQDRTIFRPPHRRPVGYVFQEASLFPHLSVRRNLLFGARKRLASAGDIRFDDVVELLGLGALLDRSPQHLSGGERQRVAIGRALLAQPRLLLMDEPLSALDHATRDGILVFLERLVGALTLPVLYVTHDRHEVERLADHLILMDKGRITASGPLALLQSDPRLPLAQSRDATVTLDAVVEHVDAAFGLLALRVAGGALFRVPTGAARVGESRRVQVAAGDVSIARERPSASTILNVLPARIVSATPGPRHDVLVVLDIGQGRAGPTILARVTQRSWTDIGLAEAMPVFAQIKSVALGASGSADALPEQFHGVLG